MGICDSHHAICVISWSCLVTLAQPGMSSFSQIFICYQKTVQESINPVVRAGWEYNILWLLAIFPAKLKPVCRAENSNCREVKLILMTSDSQLPGCPKT